MPSRQVNKDVFETCVPRGQSRQAEPTGLQSSKQGRNGDMRLRNGQREAVSFGAHFPHGWEFFQRIARAVDPVDQRKLDDVFAAKF